MLFQFTLRLSTYDNGSRENAATILEKKRPVACGKHFRAWRYSAGKNLRISYSYEISDKKSVEANRIASKLLYP